MEEIIKILSSALNARLLSTEQREAFEKGLDLLKNVPKAQSFIQESLRFRDYHRRVHQLLTYLQTFDVVSANLFSNDGKRRVGRPTRAETVAYSELMKKKKLEESKNSLFPELTPDINLQPLTYGGIIANPNGESIAATMPHLMQIRPFLSPALQEKVNHVRDLRKEMASSAEQAKMMVESNEKSREQGGSFLYTEDEIAAIATRAVEIESHILPDIYTAVDREMGECYLRLSQRTGDPVYIEHVEKLFRISPQDLRTCLKPFYEKAQKRDKTFAQTIADKIANDRPEVKTERDRKAKHKAEADAIIKYIIRKDKPSTKARIKGLTERIDILRNNYSDIVPHDDLIGYQAILSKTIEEETENAKKKEFDNAKNKE